MRPHIRTIVLILAGLAVASSAVLLDPFAMFEGGGDNIEAKPVRDRTEIRVATLSITGEADGVIQSVDSRPISSAGPGTVTSLASNGATIQPGSELFTVDEEPTVAMFGSMPAWRTMTVDDVGPDVAQLEAGLVALGYDPDGVMTVDEYYTTTTAVMVERWQADLGTEITGTVPFGAVAFVPEGALVSRLDVASGEDVTSGTTILAVASADREIGFTADAEQQLTLEVGTVLAARLPDRSSVEATVTGLASAGDGTWAVTAAIGSAEPALPDGFSVPVTITWTEVVASDVTTVEAGALIRLDTGGYAVEVVDEDGLTSFVEVAVGQRSGSTVEIITGLDSGTSVIAP